MQFINPIWFTAMAAVLIPLAIHLWNIRSGKVLKVGSIQLMGEASRQSSRSFKVTDVLLLILRCLILIVLAVLLASPFFNRTADNSKIKGWVMLPKQSFKEAYAKFRKPVDSLIAASYEFHYFDAGFTKANLVELLKDSSETVETTTSNYWELLSQLNRKKPGNLPVYLFTDNSIQHFGGSKPIIAANLHWQTYTTVDSTGEWIDKAWFTADNNIRLIKGSSKANGTTYASYTVQPGQSNALFTTTMNNAGASVSLKGNAQAMVTDTSVFRIAVVADNNQPDAAYLNAALKAIAPYIPHKVQITNYTNTTLLKQKQDWLFLLGKQTSDKKLLDVATNVFEYELGKTVNDDSWIEPGNVAINRLVTDADLAPAKDANVIWQDGHGQPVLAAEQRENRKLYKFYNRFDPAWGDLVWNDNFPKMLLALMTDDQPSAASLKNDKRVVSAWQIAPAISDARAAGFTAMAENVDLSHYVWLLLVLLFVSERFLSHNKTTITNG